MRIKSTPMTWYTILLLITSLLAILIPANPTTLHSLHITEEIYRLLIVSLLAPYAVIWFAAFYGYDQLARYSKALMFTGEGRAFQKIAKGLGVLAWGLILQVLLGSILNAITLSHPTFRAGKTIINDYFNLLVALVGFVLIENGTYELVKLVRAHHSHTTMRLLIVLGAIIAALFQREVFLSRSDNNPYYLPVYPLIFTIIIPYVFTWIIGILSVYELNMYAAKVRGLLYKHALQFLANGLSIVILLSVAIQFITAAMVAGPNSPLGTILLIDYVLLGAMAFGFILVAVGAKRLKRIEEV